jgi:hypothetical protein
MATVAAVTVIAEIATATLIVSVAVTAIIESMTETGIDGTAHGSENETANALVAIDRSLSTAVDVLNPNV